MSDEEKDVAILNVVKRRAEAKRTLALLESQLQEAGSTLQRFGEDMRKLSLGSGPQEWVEKRLPLLSPELASRIREYLAVSETVKELDASAKKLGID